MERVKHYRLRLLLAILALAVTILGFFAWQHLFPVAAGDGWASKVYLDGVSMVSALAKDGGGALYITREHNKQQGSLFKQLPDGSVQELMGGLDKPDGLIRFRDGILLTQEGGDYPVLWLHDGRVDSMFNGKSIEGIDSDAKYIYAVEDRKTDGRLLQYDLSTEQVLTLRSGLIEAEGVAVCPDGRLFYSEKKFGWVKQFRQGAEDLVVHAGLNAPGFLMCNANGLWIAEDATHGARLLFANEAGELRVILSHLRSAQTVLALTQDRLLVAEQGRNRILEINRASDGRQ